MKKVFSSILCILVMVHVNLYAQLNGVSFELGFGNYSNFYNAFKNHFGYSP